MNGSTIETSIDDSEEVYSSDLIMDNDPPTVRYNKLAYERKMHQQLLAEGEAPITIKSDRTGLAPITQRAIPKR